jgi:hypothetical protein
MFDRQSARTLRGLDWFIFEPVASYRRGQTLHSRFASPRYGASGIAGFRLCRARLPDNSTMGDRSVSDVVWWRARVVVQLLLPRYGHILRKIRNS